MAKFNEYPSKTAPEDADTLMLYDAASKTNKLSPFSGIWNWMVNKLTNAVISNLQTSNKTVVGALNELNSKSSFISKVKDVNIQVVNEYVYTGLSFTVPKNTLFIFTAKADYNNSKPLGISILDSDSNYSQSAIIENREKYPAILTYICDKASKDITYYIWAKYNFTGTNKIIIYGLQIK